MGFDQQGGRMTTESPRDPRAETESAESGSEGEKTASAAFRDAAVRLAEVREYVSFYIATKTDALKLTVRKAIFFAVVGILALLVAAGAVVTAVVMLLSGLARGLGAALGGRLWAGDLIVGFGVLAIIAVGAWIGASAMTGASRRRTVEKYESRKRDQRTRFGHDVEQPPGGN